MKSINEIMPKYSLKFSGGARTGRPRRGADERDDVPLARAPPLFLACSINQFLSTPRCINGTGEVTAAGEEGGGTLRWISIPSRGISNSASRLMLQIPGKAPA